MQANLLKLTIPFPPSVNHYYRRVGPKTMISKRGREYREAVQRAVWISQAVPNVQSGKLAVGIVAFPPDARRRDLDNLLKATLDSLTGAGVWLDDSQIQKLSVEWGTVVPQGCLIVSIECF